MHPAPRVLPQHPLLSQGNRHPIHYISLVLPVPEIQGYWVLQSVCLQESDLMPLRVHAIKCQLWTVL